MIAWTLLDSAGVPVSLGRGPVAPAGAVELPRGAILQDYARLRLVEGAWQPRPEAGPPAVTAGPSVTALVWTGLPAGARAEVRDGETGDLLGVAIPADGAVMIDLVDPGPYAVDLAAPSPWLGWSGEIVR